MQVTAVHNWHERPWFRRFRHNRPRRVLLLLAAVWIVQGFDLGFTIIAHQGGTFAELNPAASWALQRGATGAIIYKGVLVGAASVILWCCRKRALSECLLWLVVAACVGLSLRWRDYFAYFADSSHDVAIVQQDDVSVRSGLPWADARRGVASSAK